MTASLAPNEALQGHHLLLHYLANESVGAAPHKVLAEIQATYGVDLADFQRSAVTMSLEARKPLIESAIADAAYRMGKQDGTALMDDVASRVGLSAGTYEGVLERIATLPVGGNDVQRAVFAAYRRGVEAACAAAYVRATQPRQERRIQMVLETIRSSENASLNVEDAVHEAEVDLARRTPATDVDGYVTAVHYHATMCETADSIARATLSNELAAQMDRSPGYNTDEYLAAARLAISTRPARERSERMANQRASLVAASRRELEAVVARKREAALVTPRSTMMPRRERRSMAHVG